MSANAEADGPDSLGFRDPVDAGGFAIVYHCMTRDTALSDGAYRTWCLLLSYAWQNNACWPGQDVLAFYRGCDTRTVRRHLDELQERGLLTIERRGDRKTNRYVLEPIHTAYAPKEAPEERPDKNVLSSQKSDRTKMSYPATGQKCPLPTGQKCPPNNKQAPKQATKISNNNKNPAGEEDNPVVVALIATLVNAGVGKADAHRLATSLPDECHRQLDYLPYVGEFTSSPGAYLHSAIVGGFGPPKRWTAAQKRQETAQKRVQAASLTAEEQAGETARRAALDAEKARLQRDCPDVWAALVAEAERGLAPPIKAHPNGPAYQPALNGAIDRLITARGAG